MSPPISPRELAALPPKFRALLQAVIDHYEARCAALEARIAELESQLGKTPQNSSLPSGSQHPHAKPPRKAGKSKRKRGGQPGHARHQRPLIPSDECDAVHDLKPAECRCCGLALRGRDTEPLRHQVWELPEFKPLVTEYRRHRLTCRRCGAATCVKLPPGVPQGTAGPRLVALVALLMGCFRQSKRRTAMFLEQVLGQPCSPAWVVKLQNQATTAVRRAYDELVAALPRQPTLAIDETPTKEGADKAWLWTYVAREFTLFALRGSREATGVSDLLGDQYPGIVTCDRARMYLSLDRLQWCWAHLKRDFQALADSRDNRARQLGRYLGAATRRLFAHWRGFRAGAISRCALVRRMGPVRRRMERLLQQGAASGCKLYAGMCRELCEHRHHLWRFLKHDGVEPTNNSSERALRHPVIWRKLSFGTQSAAGSRFVETMLTVVETCRQQGRRPFDYLTQALQAQQNRHQSPSLLPGA